MQASSTPVGRSAVPKSKSKNSFAKSCLGCLGGLGILAALIVAGVVYTNNLKKELAENRDKIMSQVKAAASAGDHKRVVEIASKYAVVEDQELDKYLNASRDVLKAAEEKQQAAEQKKRDAAAAAEEKERAAKAREDAAAEARRRPDPRRSRVYQDSWTIGYADGERARRNGEHPIGQYIQMEALNAAQKFYPSSPMDQMEFASGYTDGYGRGYGQ